MILVVGLSFRSAPVEVRERFATAADALPAVLARLSARPELGEVMFLSTCNRVEILAATPGRTNEERARALALKAIRDVLCEHAAVTDGELRQFLYEKHGEESVRHIFRVAASLDSMVLGEPQILGQVKSAYDAAMAAGTLKGYLGRCVHRAFTVAKRVRTETQIGAGLVSISSVAVDLAKRVFGDLSDRRVLLVGAGEMGEAAARSLGKGARSLHVCNRTEKRGQTLARDVGGTYVPWSELERELAQADAVITAAASPTWVVTLDLAKRVMKARRGRTLLFVDIAVPRNVDPAAHALDNVFAFDVDDLEQQVARGLDARQTEARAAESIVEEQVGKFLAWSRGLDVTPAIIALRTRTHATLASELERTLGGRLKHLGAEDRAALEQMIESAVNKILHVPTTRLRDAASSGDGADLVEHLTELFDLPTSSGDAADGGKTEEDDERIVQ